MSQDMLTDLTIGLYLMLAFVNDIVNLSMSEANGSDAADFGVRVDMARPSTHVTCAAIGHGEYLGMWYRLRVRNRTQCEASDGPDRRARPARQTRPTESGSFCLGSKAGVPKSCFDA